MEQSKIDMFVSTNKDCFTPTQWVTIKEQLAAMSEDKMTALSAVSFKNPTTMLIISIFLGWAGVDRFMLGQIGLGIAKLVTCGGSGVWEVIDWFLIKGKTYEYNFAKFNEAMMH